MSKFKAGDKVKVLTKAVGDRGYTKGVGAVKTITSVESDGKYRIGGWWYAEHDLELIGGENTVKERRTFKLIKDTPTHKKGQLFQEECEDGTQPYAPFPLHPNDYKFNIDDRSLVENQPQWFVEVFKVTPEYMTREELDKWETFKGQKKRGRPVGVKSVTKPKKQKRAGWSAERRAKFEARKRG